MSKLNLAAFLVLNILFTGCSTKKASQSSMIPAVRWTKSSAEYKALSMQAYQTAASRLNELFKTVPKQQA